VGGWLVFTDLYSGQPYFDSWPRHLAVLTGRGFPRSFQKMSVKLYTVGRVSIINEGSRKGVVRVLARGCVYEFRPAIELPVYS
jgi:hypothetical protein